MMRQLRSRLVVALLCVSSCAAYANPRAHYQIVLPDGYVGWVQVIFNDPDSSPLPHDHQSGTYLINVKNDGIVRTSDLRVHDDSSITELLYLHHVDGQADQTKPIPTSSIILDDSLGGFGVMDTGGKGRGYSWFFFIGSPQLRAKYPKADWDKFVQQWHIDHGNKKVVFDGRYPTPGKIEQTGQ